MLTDGQTTDAGVTGILIAHLRAFGSGELKIIALRPAIPHLTPKVEGQLLPVNTLRIFFPSLHTMYDTR